MIGTTVKQSKELLKAGVASSTADMTYILNPKDGGYILVAQPPKFMEDIPCWSMGRLWEICQERGIELEFSTGEDSVVNIIPVMVMEIINDVKEALKPTLEFIKEHIK